LALRSERRTRSTSNIRGSLVNPSSTSLALSSRSRGSGARHRKIVRSQERGIDVDRADGDAGPSPSFCRRSAWRESAENARSLVTISSTIRPKA
jgi:hypothetical protein